MNDAPRCQMRDLIIQQNNPAWTCRQACEDYDHCAADPATRQPWLGPTAEDVVSWFEQRVSWWTCEKAKVQAYLTIIHTTISTLRRENTRLAHERAVLLDTLLRVKAKLVDLALDDIVDV